MDCQNCRLGYNISLNGRGPKGAKVMFVQDFPEPIDLKYNKQFAGKSCNSLLVALKNRGINEDEVYFTSIVKCPAYQGEEEIKPKDVKCCADLLETEINLINPKVIVPVGKQSLKYLIGVNTLTKSRGKAIEKEFKYTDEEGNTTTINRIILPMVHPRQLKLKPIYKEYTLNDLDTLAKLVEEGMPKSDELHYEYLETVESALQGIRDIQNNAEVIAFDIETNTLNAFQDDAKVLCISMSYKTHSGVCIPLQHKDSPFKDKDLELVLNALKELLENDTLKVAHNGKFDIKFLEAVLGIKVNNFNFDTQIAHYLAISEERGTQGLKSLAWEYTDMGGYDNALDDYKKSLPTSKQGNYENIPWDILKEYAVCDTDCTLRLYYIFQPLIEENPKWKVVMYDILMPASYTLKDVETNGMLFDVELGEKYLKEYAEEAERIQQALEEFPEVLEIVEDRKKKWMYREELKKIPKRDRTEEENIKFKEYAKYKNPEFNWSSVNQLRELFFDKLNLETSVKTDKGEYSTSAEALEEMQNQHEIPKLLTELRKINILNNFFITKFPELKDKNNIIHSTFNMTLTATGRMSSSDPNFQQIPRKVEDVTSFQYHHEVKSLFVSRFGDEGCIMNQDYCLAADTEVHLINGEVDTIKNICDRLNNGEDLYTYSINPKTEEIVVSKVLAGRKTRENEETLVITLDNGESVTCSRNHKFLLRNGQYVAAEDLNIGTSLMGYTEKEHINKGEYVAYRYIGVNKNFKNMSKEHKLIYTYFNPNYNTSYNIHHIDGNGLNNIPSNLKAIPQSEHMSYHMKEYWASISKEERIKIARERISEEGKEVISKCGKEWWANLSQEEYKTFCKKLSESCNDRSGENNVMYGKTHTESTIQKMSDKRKQYYANKTEEEKRASGKTIALSRIDNFVKKLLAAGYSVTEEDYMAFRAKESPRMHKWEKAVPYLLELGYITNHKIVDISVGTRQDLYDIEVETNHNFPLACGVFVHNCALEMRVAGVISGDENLKSAFLSGQDLHKSTASLIWNVPIDEVSKTLRTQAKAVNFGLIYGKTGASFAKDFYYDEKGEDPEKFSDWGRAKQEGEKLVNDYLGTFSGLRDWLNNTKKFAHKHGYVETMFGRRRRLPNLKSQVHGMKSDAERQAINAPIQGTGSDFTVMSLNQINDYFKKHDLKSMIIATVHDSIVFDVYIPELAEVAEVVKTIMESVHKPYIDTEIPINTDIELGSNYGAVFEISLDECKSIKTVEDYNKWLAIQNREKYETEMKQLKKKGFTEIQVEKYLQKYNRPKDLLDFFKNLV